MASKRNSQPETKRISRRELLGGAVAAGAAFTIVPRHVLGGRGYTPPSEVITRAVIGTGGMGMAGHVLENAPGSPPVTLAVCDVDENHLAAAMKKAGEPCKAYRDWRRVLDRKDIDTIHIATPPHWHALMGIAAAQCGFDILSEKPFTRTIAEGQVYRDTVRRYGRVLQINTHFRFGNYYQYGAAKMLRKLVDSGLLGRPLTVRAGMGQGFNWKIKMWSGRTNLPPEPIPAELDYDMWLGPAPVVPYHPHRVHQSFRGYWDYDGGGLSDMGQHYLDPIQYFLGKDDTSPVEIEAEAPWPQHPDAVGLWGRVTMKYADGDALIVESGEWASRKEATKPRSHEATKGTEQAAAPFIEGPKGKVYDNYRTDPPGLFDKLGAVADPPPLVDFESAVRTREKTGGNEAVSHRSCTLVNLATIAIRTGRRLRYDPVKEEFINDEQANRLVSQPMRAPWHL
jgi:predicted dehydrogenase